MQAPPAVTVVIGQRSVPTDALRLDDMTAAVIPEENEVGTAESVIDDYAENRLETTCGSTANHVRTR